MSLILPQEDIPHLQDVASNHSDFRTRRAAKAILQLAESEDTKENIAAGLGITRSGLYRIEKRYKDYALDGLILSSKVGRPTIITE